MNPYIVLGVNKNDSLIKIKKAYKRLAQKYHPDKSNGDSYMFDRVQRAWKMLKTPGARKNWERYSGEPCSQKEFEIHVLSETRQLLMALLEEISKCRNPDATIQHLLNYIRTNITLLISKSMRLENEADVRTKALIASRDLISTTNENSILLDEALACSIDKMYSKVHEMKVKSLVLKNVEKKIKTFYAAKIYSLAKH